MRGKTNDPADWNESSYWSHPVDSIEPIETVPSEYKIWKGEFMDFLRGLDQFMCKGGKPPRKWKAFQIAVLASGETETAVAHSYGVTRAAVSKDVVLLQKLTKLEHMPAFGLKSFKDRQTYMRTNGRRRARESWMET